jgi:hypothetical protein
MKAAKQEIDQMTNTFTTAHEDIIEQIGDITAQDCNPDEAIITRDTLEQFLAARENWSEMGRINADDSVEGTRYIEITSAQSAKGQPRRDLIIVDLGEFRAVIEF